MKIITYQEKYRNQIIALILYLQNYENKVDLSLEEQPDMSDIENYYRKMGGEFWLAVSDEDDVVGTLGLMRKSDTAILKKFFVQPKFRGKEIGTADKLFRCFLKFCCENGICRIVLDTPSACYRAHAFYKKHGFFQITKEELPIAYDYPDRDSLIFIKNIDKKNTDIKKAD